VEEVMTPWAGERGITIHTVRKRRKDGSGISIAGKMTQPGTLSVTVPAFGSLGKMALPRGCTRDFKVVPMLRWLKANGATAETPAIVAVGFSTDEWHRATNGKDNPRERRVFPLLDLRLDRAACMALIARAGLPVPPKSSCYFCPYHSLITWRALRRDRPDLFAQAASIEAVLHAKLKEREKSPLFLTRYGVPLPDAIHPAQQALPGLDDTCDSGHCFL